FYASSRLSQEATILLWRGLATTTRKTYESAVNLYETFTKLRRAEPFPALIDLLSAWIVATIIKTKAKTTKKYLQGLRSYHIDMGYDASAFDDPRLERFIRGGKRYYGDVGRRERLPITRDILIRILQQIPSTYDGINIRAALCVAFAGFLRAGEITYSEWEESSPNFALTRSSILFDRENIILTLPASKTDFFQIGRASCRERV